MMKPNQEVLLHGCYDNRNFGDVLMADMLSQYLSKEHELIVRCPGMLPDIAEKMPCTPTGLISGPRRCQLAIYGGGGYLHGSSLRNVKRLLRYTVPAGLMRAKGTAYSIIGVGAGPNISRLSAPLIRTLCAGATKVAVRETQSRDLLTSIGVEADKLEVTADLVMSLQPEHIPGQAIVAAKEMIANSPNSDRPKRFGIHLSVPVAKTEMLHQLMQSIKKGLDGDDDTALYWLQDHGNRTETFREIADQYLPSCHILPPVDHWQLAAILGQMDAIMTTKLHVAIAAWALGKPVCGFSNHQKTSRFFAQIDRAPFQAMHDENPEVIAEWVAGFVKQDERFFADNPDSRAGLIAASKRNFQLIDDLVREV